MYSFNGCATNTLIILRYMVNVYFCIFFVVGAVCQAQLFTIMLI